MTSLETFSNILPLFEETFADISSQIGSGEGSDSARMLRVLTVLKGEFTDEQLKNIPDEEWRFLAHALFAKIGQEVIFGIEKDQAENFFRNAVLNLLPQK